MNYSRGVIYVAYGKSYVDEAIKSAKSLKKYNPELNITLYTNLPNLVQNDILFDKVFTISSKPDHLKTAPYAKLNKIKAMSTFPYDLTLYLDCDTKVRQSIMELFDVSSFQSELMICNSPKLDKTQRPFKLIKYQRTNAYNSGVILYRNTVAITNLFKNWLELAEQDPKALTNNQGKFFDQPKLVKLLNDPQCPVIIKILPNTIYNARHTMFEKMKKDKIFNKAKIIHGHKI